jgi:hypothetical protein
VLDQKAGADGNRRDTSLRVAGRCASGGGVTGEAERAGEKGRSGRQVWPREAAEISSGMGYGRTWMCGLRQGLRENTALYKRIRTYMSIKFYMLNVISCNSAQRCPFKMI